MANKIKFEVIPGSISLISPVPTGDAAGLSITNDREDLRFPWIELDCYAFNSEEDWKILCGIAGCNPDTTERIRIYIHKIESQDDDSTYED